MTGQVWGRTVSVAGLTIVLLAAGLLNIASVGPVPGGSTTSPSGPAPAPNSGSHEATAALFHAHAAGVATALHQMVSSPGSYAARLAVHPAASGPASILWTIDLLNGTLTRGDFVPSNAISPIGVAYDGGTGNLYVSDWGSNVVSVVSAASGALIATIPVGMGPSGLVYDAATGEIFVADQYSNDLTVISDATNSVVATIPVGSSPEGIALDTRFAELFVVNNGSGNVSVVSAITNHVVANVPVGIGPSAVAVDSPRGDVFVANWGSDTVSEISDLTDAIVATFGVGSGPSGLAVDSSEHAVFVANSGSDDVSVTSEINSTTYLTVPVGDSPDAVAYDPGTGSIYVANSGSDNVSVIAGASDALVGVVEAGPGPEGLAYDGALGEIFVTNFDANDLTVIKEVINLPVATIPLGIFADGVAATGPTGTIFVAGNDSNELYVVSARNYMIDATPSVGFAPEGTAYDSSQSEVFVAANASNVVTVVSTSSDKVVATIPAGIGPAALAYDPAQGQVFVANANNSSDSVSVISDTTDQVVATIPVGFEPDALAYDSGRDEVFVANNLSGTLTVISATTDHVVTTVTVGPNPDGVAYDSANNEIFVADETSDNVSVVSDVTNHVVATIPVGFYPEGMAYDGAQGEVYVANTLSDNVSVISDASDAVVGTVPVGLSPVAVAYDAPLAQILVANEGSGTVSVLSDGSSTVYDALLSVQVTNSSDEPVAGATVSVGPDQFTTNSSGDAEFLLANGTYLVNATAPEYLATSETVDLSGSANISLTVGYPFDYLGTIPPGDLNITAVFGGVDILLHNPFSGSPGVVFFDWKRAGTVGAGGTVSFFANQIPSLVVLAAAPGSVDYPDAYYALPVSSVGAGCGALPGGNGAAPPVTVDPPTPVYGSPTLITLELHDTCPYTLHLPLVVVEIASFNAGGAIFTPIGDASNITLAPGAYDNISVIWNTTFNAAAYGYHHCVRIEVDYASPVPPQGQTVSGLHNLDIEPNMLSGESGSVTFTVRNPDNGNETISFTVNARMPAGWTDSVELNGMAYTSPTFQVNFTGGQTMSGVLTIDPDPSTPGTGAVWVNSTIGGTQNASFEKELQELPPGHYPVDFTETGLPAGTNWSVVLAGTKYSSSTNVVYANELDGVYSFSIGSVAGYSPNPSTGSVTVNGDMVNVDVTFAIPAGVYCASLSLQTVFGGHLRQNFSSNDSAAVISFFGQLSLTPTLSVCLGTTPGGFLGLPKPVWLNITEGLAESAVAAVNASGRANFSNLDDPYEFGDPVPLGCVVIGIVPVCADATIDVGLEAELTANASLVMHQGITVQASQNYSFTSGKWSTVPVTPTCQQPGASLAYGCATFSANATIQGSLLVKLGPMIDINALDLLGIYLWPYVGLNVSAGFSTNNSNTGDCGGEPLGWAVADPWLVVCGLLGIQVGGDVLGSDEFTAFDWTAFEAPMGASVIVCGEQGSPCGNSIRFTPAESVTLEALGAVGGLSFTWTSPCLPGTETGSEVSFVAPSTVGSDCPIVVTTGLPLVVILLDISATEIRPSVVPADTVTFQEAGLPLHAQWSVTAGPLGQSESSTGTSVQFTVPQGLVGYSVQGPAGYSSSVTSPASATSPVNVVGPTKIMIKFGHLEELTLREAGLPPGTMWSVMLASGVSGGPATVSRTTTNASTTFVVVADPYRWSVVSSTSQFKPAHAHGAVGVTHAGKVVKITFGEVASKVTFSEKGLPKRARWSVTIEGGPTLNGTGSSISLKLANGTYRYAIASAATTYTTDSATGALTVAAPVAVKITVKFADPPSTTPPEPGTPSWVDLFEIASHAIDGSDGTFKLIAPVSVLLVVGRGRCSA